MNDTLRIPPLTKAETEQTVRGEVKKSRHSKLQYTASEYVLHCFVFHFIYNRRLKHRGSTMKPHVPGF